jgi:hypothetical protein
MVTLVDVEQAQRRKTRWEIEVDGEDRGARREPHNHFRQLQLTFAIEQTPHSIDNVWIWNWYCYPRIVRAGDENTLSSLGTSFILKKTRKL